MRKSITAVEKAIIKDMIYNGKDKRSLEEVWFGKKEEKEESEKQ
jgi:hypothetical protein